MIGKHFWEMSQKQFREKISVTYQELLENGKKVLKDAGIEEFEIDAWLLLEYIADIDRTFFLMNRFAEADLKVKKNYEEVLKRRSQRIPLQHITGFQEFMGYNFIVNENVLIPRQDTEILVEEADKFILGNEKVLDMCTGSGCIIISLKKMNPSVKAVAVDLSVKALEVAEENAKLNQVEVEFINSDLFSNVTEKFNIIVSNPPYIPTKVIEGLMPEVRKYEPMMALDGTEDGLLFYRNIIENSKEYLEKNGMLMFEIGHDQGESVSAFMKTAGFMQVQVIKDLAGLDRVVTGRLV